MACLAALPVRLEKVCSSVESERLRFLARLDSKFSPATSSASNHQAEAATASRIEAQPITPRPSQRIAGAAMQQTWKRLTFLHWPYDPTLVHRLLPTGLELDTFDDAAWIGLVPFEIHNFPGIPHF